MTSCSGPDEKAQNLATAERMIDAFYSFDPDQLEPLLAHAPESAKRLLYYQGWAEGGNYKVLERPPCEAESDTKINCPVTVQDDPVVALNTGFNVTDTFHLTFENGNIVEVDTSSNDQPIYFEARKWVEANMPDVMTGPCKGRGNMTEEATPGDCARAMTAGYARFYAATQTDHSEPFIPDEFSPPTLVEAEGFKVVPLGPELVDIDFEAYMSSIEHLQQTFTRSTAWPTQEISDEDAMLDMQNEQRRFEARESFAYAVLTPDGSRERGCVYVRPSSRPGYDAVVRLWVTKDEFDAGFDEELYAWSRQWVADTWPFARVAYPGRAIDWDTWDALPEA